MQKSDKDQMQELLRVVKSVRHGDSVNIDSDNKGIVAEIGEVLNDIIERDKDLASQIIKARVHVIEEDEKLAHNKRYLRLAQLEVESLKRYQNLANSIPHVVWRAKANGTMDYFNKVWTNFTGLASHESVGNGWQRAFHPEDLRHFLKTWIQNIGSAEDFEVECRIKNKNGDFSWHLIRAIAECRLSGEIIAWLGTCTDIHERKITEEKLIKAQQQADAASLAKTNFLANMSHEIRTPLNSILGFTELMLSSDISAEDQAKNLATIRKNGQLLLKIIDEIIDISKVETGHLEMEEIETDLSQLLIDMHTLLNVQAQEKSLELSFKCSGFIPSKIVTDPTRLRQILVNIIGNSIKFTQTGKVEMEVSWHPEISTGMLRCLVKDTGIGIDPAEAVHLFQPFVQVDNSKSRRFGGTGLGLALSLRLAKALNGSVKMLESKKNEGSVFLVEIQTQPSPRSVFINSLDTSVQEMELPIKNYQNALKNLKILVVDDSSDNRNLITQFLVAAGAQVDSAVDGVDGVSKALEKDYEIILMDIQMPNLDGYKATAQLRQQGYVRPIIALTAHALKQEKINSLNAGCDDHLTKPIDRRTLIDQVKKYVNQSASSARLMSV